MGRPAVSPPCSGQAVGPLDLESAEALEDGLSSFEGTVVAVTHDRWFLRSFDRFLVFNEDCSLKDLLEPPALYR